MRKILNKTFSPILLASGSSVVSADNIIINQVIVGVDANHYAVEINNISQFKEDGSL